MAWAKASRTLTEVRKPGDATAAASRGRARIFVVDDEPANLKLLDKMLASGAHENRVLIDDSREVLGHYRAQRPDLILLDINMPYLDGYEVLAQLRGLNDPLVPPVIMATAAPDSEFLIRAYQAGAHDFLTKPFDRVELLMRVRSGLALQSARRALYRAGDPDS